MVVRGMPEHSPLGASGASRWMECPGSVQQSQGIMDEESDDAALGTCAHSLAEHCLQRNVEPWALIGAAMYKGIEVDKEMADAVWSYVNAIYEWHPGWEKHQYAWVERRFHCPDIHELFYGTADFVYYDSESGVLDVWDYKHGIGVVVEADDNPQLKYYAAGVLETFDLWAAVTAIRLHIFQPRGWHVKGPHRHWECDPDELDGWLDSKLIPAMNLASVSRDTKPGLHCRFCPARQAQCPGLMGAMVEYQELIMKADEKGAEALTDEQIGHLLNLHELGKIVSKAVNKVAHGKLSTGHLIPGCKLVASRTNRKFKEGADEAAVKKFGKRKAYTTPVLKTPAQLDELPGGREFTARWAFKPEGGTTIATEKDPRKAIKRDAKSLFKPVKEESK